MLCFCEMYFAFGCAKHLEPYYFFELSHQQHNNISGLAARYKIFGVNAHKEIISFEIVCPSKYKILVAVAFGGNAASIALRLVLGPPRLRTISFHLLMFYAVFVSLWPLFHSDGDILLVLLRQRLIWQLCLFSRSQPFRPPFFCCFAPGHFARFHVRRVSFRITVATSPHAASPNNRFYKMFLSAITFVIDEDISLYSSLHFVENVYSLANINVPLCVT